MRRSGAREPSPPPRSGSPQWGSLPICSSTSARHSIRSSTRPTPPRWMRCWRSSAGPSIRPAHPSTIPPRCTAPTTRAGRWRSLGWQLANYFQYFDWQWARSLADGARQVVTIAFLTLGLRGLWEQRRSDRPAWWLLLGIFLVTGLGLVAYMNFRPGFSLAFHRWPERGRPRGPRAGLLLRGELHRVGALGRDRRRRVRRRPLAQGEAPGRGARAAAWWLWFR